MAMTKVSEVTVGSGGAASIEFTGIAGTGKDLLVLVSSRADNFNGKITFNSNTSSIYSRRNLYGAGSGGVGSQETTNGASLVVPALHEPKNFNGTDNTIGIASNGQIYVANYAGSTNKSISVDTVMEANDTESYQSITAATFASAAAITSLKIESNTGNLLEYSSASLYIIS